MLHSPLSQTCSTEHFKKSSFNVVVWGQKSKFTQKAFEMYYTKPALNTLYTWSTNTHYSFNTMTLVILRLKRHFTR